jgi:hypothetical protein
MVLLGVKLDDELFLNSGVDLSTNWQLVNQNAHAAWDNFNPRWHSAITMFGASNLERCEFT